MSLLFLSGLSAFCGCSTLRLNKPASMCTALHPSVLHLQALLTPTAGAKAGGLTPRDVFDDLQTPAPGAGGAGGDTAGEELGLLAAQHSARGPSSAERAAGVTLGAPGTLSRRGTAAAGELEEPLTARSDVFDFLATPRTEAGAFAAPQASGRGLARAGSFEACCWYLVACRAHTPCAAGPPCVAGPARLPSN